MLIFKGRQIQETLSEIVRPQRTAVVVHDMQKDNTGKGGAYDRAGRRIDVTHILGPLVRFLDEARQCQVRVMYTQYTNLPDFATFTEPRIREFHKILTGPDEAKRDALGCLVDGTWGWEVIDELSPREGEISIRKYRVDAFIGTPFEYLLRLYGVKTLIPTGIATEVGILPTAWHALNLGLFVVVPEDCVAAMQKEYHEEAMAFLRRLAIVASSQEIISAWRSGSR